MCTGKEKASGFSPKAWQRMKDSNGETPFAANQIVPTRSPLRGNRSGMTFVRVRIHLTQRKKPPVFTEGLAADEGFEPSQTESESGVLPLH